MFRLYYQSISSTQLTIIFHLSIINYGIVYLLEVLFFQIMQDHQDPLRLTVELKTFHLILLHRIHPHFQLFEIIFPQNFQINQQLFFLLILSLRLSKKNHLFYYLVLHFLQVVIFIYFLFGQILLFLFLFFSVLSDFLRPLLINWLFKKFYLIIYFQLLRKFHVIWQDFSQQIFTLLMEHEEQYLKVFLCCLFKANFKYFLIQLDTFKPFDFYYLVN